ncbi:MAG: DNA polymerase [Rhodospirillaceae bacterium]
MKAVLVDQSNFNQLKDQIGDEISKAELIGLDIETQDHNRHEGLNLFMKVDDDGFKSSATKLIFDRHATVLCGLSLHCDLSDTSYYFNLGHSDVDERLCWTDVVKLLVRKSVESRWVIHNWAFESVMLRSTVGWEPKIEESICTMQLAVSAYGPDEYNVEDYIKESFEAMKPLLRDAVRVFKGWTRDKKMTTEQADLIYKILGKQSSASWSYNGIITGLNWGYGLKKAVKRWLGVEMASFKDTLGDRPHMGCLSGAETVDYGADDAYYAVQLYKKLLSFMMETNPKSIVTYFNQEIPALQIFADINFYGWRINLDAVEARRLKMLDEARVNLRELRVNVRALLPFPELPHPGLMDREGWYGKHWQEKRQAVTEWANLPDRIDELAHISGGIAKAAGTTTKQINIGHYYVARVLYYDLLREKELTVKGKVTSDAAARGKLIERLKDKTKINVLRGLSLVASADQNLKLYITPYKLLCHPDTKRVYPVPSSMLASRRISMQNPNTQQLAKRGNSVFVRGFFLADDEDEVLISLDYQQIELVLIGELSGDNTYLECYNKNPYDDLHSITTARLLQLPVEDFLSIKRLPATETSFKGVEFKDNAGTRLSPQKFVKWARTVLGKGANFSYAYSGALSQVGELMGWTSEEMWAAVEVFRQTYPMAEAWRIKTISECQEKGFVVLPDGHRRVRYEATPHWAHFTRMKLRSVVGAPEGFAEEIIRSIQRRAGNQAVNSMIQGTCATLMKRSLVSIRQEFLDRGLKARIVGSIHDEIVVSAHHSIVQDVIEIMNRRMTTHPDIFTRTVPLTTASVGKTFEPYSDKAPFGQIELAESPDLPFIPEDRWGRELNSEQIQRVVEYLQNGT